MKQPLKVAAISGIILIIISILSIFIGPVVSSFKILIISQIYSVIYGIAYLVLGVLYGYGFVVIGKRYNSKLLVVLAYIGIITTVVLYLGLTLFNVIYTIPAVSAQSNFGISQNSQSQTTYPAINYSDNPELKQFAGMIDPNTGEPSQAFYNLMIFVLIIWVIICIVYGLYSILFGIALIKLKDKVPFSNVSGILNIIGGATCVFFIGFIVLFAAMILQIIMFFRCSNQFEVEKKEEEKVAIQKIEEKKEEVIIEDKKSIKKKNLKKKSKK